MLKNALGAKGGLAGDRSGVAGFLLLAESGVIRHRPTSTDREPIDEGVRTFGDVNEWVVVRGLWEEV